MYLIQSIKNLLVIF